MCAWIRACGGKPAKKKIIENGILASGLVLSGNAVQGATSVDFVRINASTELGYIAGVDLTNVSILNIVGTRADTCGFRIKINNTIVYDSAAGTSAFSGSFDVSAYSGIQTLECDVYGNNTTVSLATLVEA